MERLDWKGIATLKTPAIRVDQNLPKEGVCVTSDGLAQYFTPAR
jgi:hypothetical protein